MTDEQIAKLPKHRRDWLEIHGNTWKPRKFDGIACEACVYGTSRGEHHARDCKHRGILIRLSRDGKRIHA